MSTTLFPPQQQSDFTQAQASEAAQAAISRSSESSKAATSDKVVHNSVEIKQGMSVDDYVSQSTKMHYGAKHQGVMNGSLLQFCRKVGDMALAVIPKNRFWCAVGLTSGGFMGLKLAELMTGRNLSTQKEITKEYPKLLQPLKGIMKYDPHSSAQSDRWKKVGALFIFTGVSFVGVMAGARYAYRNSRKINEHPDGLEDYLARTSQHQGDKWRWLAASSGIFGSSAGTYMIPYVPGINYGTSIAGYTVLNQDRKVLTPGFSKASGAATMSYLGLREGVDYVCKYAVNNPTRDPAELEFLALTVMGPLADASGAKLEPKQIKAFVDKIHETRDKYWQEGGIPPAMRKEAMKDMEAHFKGKGLDKTLYECGLDTAKIDFTKINGYIGKVGNTLGATKAIQKDQLEYREKVAGWRKEWMPAQQQPGDKLQGEEVAQAQTQGTEKTFAREDLKKQPVTGRPRHLTHSEALAYSSKDDVLSTSL